MLCPLPLEIRAEGLIIMKYHRRNNQQTMIIFSLIIGKKCQVIKKDLRLLVKHLVIDNEYDLTPCPGCKIGSVKGKQTDVNSKLSIYPVRQEA